MADPNLKMYRSDSLAEIGTEGNPIDFGLCNAGENTTLPYDILLYNDKDGTLESFMARELQIELLRLIVTETWDSDGSPSQEFTMAYIPVSTGYIVEEEVTIDEVQWRRVSEFTGLGATELVYTFDYASGLLTFGNNINGKIPPNSSTIKIRYTPDLNSHGKTIYIDQWISMKSAGTIANEVDVDLEESIKINNDTVEVINYPDVTSVTGVWDNPEKTGTNYYTGGSFDHISGRIDLGTSLPDESTPYTEYSYQIKDDNESTYTSLGNEVIKVLQNPIPYNNAKKLQLKVTIPSDASTEGGVYLKVILRVYYKF